MSSRNFKGTFGHANSTVRGRSRKFPFSFDRTFSASSSDEKYFGKSAGSNQCPNQADEYYEDPQSTSSTNPLKDSGVDGDGKEAGTIHDDPFLDDDELSTGLPSDLPSSLVDIEGNLIDGENVNLQFGQEEGDDEDGVNSEDDEVSSLPHEHEIQGKLRLNNRQRRRMVNQSRIKLFSQSDGGGGRDSSSAMISNGRLPPSFRNPHHYLRSDREVLGNLRRPGVPGGRTNNGLNREGKALPGDRKNSLSECSSASTITQHYYPEGGWGYIILLTAVLCHCFVLGINLNAGIFIWNLINRFQDKVTLSQAGWLGAASVGISLLFSPIWVSICKRKSTRLAAVFGGLVASLGCLFTSFTSQFHQLFISYGLFIGVGVGLTRDASSLMVGQYFKRKRDLVEIIVVSGSGLGILVMSVSIHTAISSLGWRIGLQAITGSLFVTFFLGTCYRSASLYHPQRRAILHLKNQKRKIKEKEKREEKPPFLDFTSLRSKTLQILLLSSGLTAFGITTPLFYLAVEYENEMVKVGGGELTKDELSLVLLHVSVGTCWILGCILFGLIVVQKNQDCRVSKQYLCQMAGVICGISILSLTAVEGFNGLIIFSCVYGFSLGGYNYALKVYTYERVRARHFPRAWSFIQSAQAIPLFLGVPFTGYVNSSLGSKSGYYLSAVSVIIGSACLFLTDVRRRRLSRRKAQNSSMKTCETLESAQSPKIRRLSFAFPVEQVSPQSKHDSTGEAQGPLDPGLLAKELTCISEEGIADMDFQDIYFEEWAEYFGADCITSCNKVENCLVSEYDPDYTTMLLDRKSRRWSAARPNLAQATSSVAGCIAGLATNPPQISPGSSSSPSHSSAATTSAQRVQMTLPKEIPSFKNPPRSSRPPLPGRSITVIDEAEASV